MVCIINLLVLIKLPSGERASLPNVYALFRRNHVPLLQETQSGSKLLVTALFGCFIDVTSTALS
jgi:hypothetical protein